MHGKRAKGIFGIRLIDPLKIFIGELRIVVFDEFQESLRVGCVWAKIRAIIGIISYKKRYTHDFALLK